MVGGSLLHGLPLVGLPNIYIIYIYIYNSKDGPWAYPIYILYIYINNSKDINQKILFIFYFYFLKQCIFLKGCKLSERLHSVF